MEGLLWVAAATALFVLLHVVVAAYLYRESASDGRESASEYLPAQDGDDGSPRAATEDRVPCPTCGTPNDPRYRFCRRCIADLQSSVASPRGTEGGKRLGS